jgi:hypothetical protein
MAGRRIEDGLQRGICDMLMMAGRKDLVWFAVPNGGARSKIEAAIMKGLGVKAGAPDLLLVIPPAGRIAGLELKAPGKTPTPAQIYMGKAIVDAGGYFADCDSIDKAIRILSTWRAIDPDRLRISA